MPEYVPNLVPSAKDSYEYLLIIYNLDAEQDLNPNQAPPRCKKAHELKSERKKEPSEE